jgi:hypothetical protein
MDSYNHEFIDIFKYPGGGRVGMDHSGVDCENPGRK